MNLYLTKISRSYVKGVMRYQGGQGDPLPPGIRCSNKTLGILRVKRVYFFLLNRYFESLNAGLEHPRPDLVFKQPRLLDNFIFGILYCSELHKYDLDDVPCKPSIESVYTVLLY